ncbi:R-spondin-3 [Protopterus annectens]|uniref:R-spondin-3 n=1 Tax=Protopterus annectens TaxID=7888 RepID=UPI001CFA5075|nr:R-spondin-3 [Protopterus annectens]
MQLRLIALVFIILNFMEYIESQQGSRGRRHRRTHPSTQQGCQGGCASCSDYNGCVSCKPRLFFFLKRSGMKQIGVCLSSCPNGYFGERTPEINKCAKCKPDCDACFNKNFCTKCKSGLYLQKGKCLESCPESFEPSNHTMECKPIAHCEVSDWTSWSPCTKKGKTCGFKKGNESRSRDVLQFPSALGSPCPSLSETRNCIVQRVKCPKEERGKKAREKNRRKAVAENADDTQENRNKESRRESRNREEHGKRDVNEQRKRKKQSKNQSPASVSTEH